MHNCISFAKYQNESTTGKYDIYCIYIECLVYCLIFDHHLKKFLARQDKKVKVIICQYQICVYIVSIWSPISKIFHDLALYFPGDLTYLYFL